MTPQGLDVAGPVWAVVSLVGGIAAAGLLMAVCYRPAVKDAAI
nr:hypothetical protein [Janibacter limosus]